MSLIGDAIDGVEHLAKDAVLAPAEIAHWALSEMFGGGTGDLEKIAAELAALGKQMEGLAKDISSGLSQLTWHGPAADAFIGYAQGRVRELTSVADELDGLSKSVVRLAHVY